MKGLINKILVAVILISASHVSYAQGKIWSLDSWMSQLPNETYICSMSIPGTHDSCTYTRADDVVGSWATAQTFSLQEQFDRGVRCFDLRPRYQEGVDGDLEIHHGAVDCEMTFNKALQDLENAVGNTRECIIVFVNREQGDKEAGNFAIYKREAEMIKDSHYIQFRPDLTLGEARGRIIILNRDPLYECGSSCFGGFIDDYGGFSYRDKEGEIRKRVDNIYVVKDGQKELACKFYTQDDDNYSMAKDYMTKKIAPYQACADAYFNDPDYFVWSSNQASAWVGFDPVGIPIGMDYFQNAEVVHPWLRDYCNNTARYHEPGKWRGVGICMMDYAGLRTHVEWTSTVIYGDELVEALINLNF